MPRLGQGFFALDLDAVQKAVAALPWVESVEASKRWPDTLLLRIYERQPFARWNDKQLISRQGQVFDVPAADLTPEPAEPAAGRTTDLAEVVSFYADTPQGLCRHASADHRRGADRARQLEPDARPAARRSCWATASRRPRRLRRFLDVYPQLIAGHDGGFAYADLRYTNGFAVRWTPPAPAAITDGGAPRS